MAMFKVGVGSSSDELNSCPSNNTSMNLSMGSITVQGIIQTKMEVIIQFWVPNLGLSPKYD